MNEHLNKGSFAVITITFVCFFLALFVKGFTHDLLLEIGIFVISVKLIIMAYKNSLANKNLQQELQTIKRLLIEREN